MAENLAEREREQMDPGPATNRGKVVDLRAHESRPADHVDGRIGSDRCDEARELAWLVLAVAVDLRHVVVAMLERVLKAGLHSAADP